MLAAIASHRLRHAFTGRVRAFFCHFHRLILPPSLRNYQQKQHERGQDLRNRANLMTAHDSLLSPLYPAVSLHKHEGHESLNNTVYRAIETPVPFAAFSESLSYRACR
jgi:hypothetical protein